MHKLAPVLAIKKQVVSVHYKESFFGEVIPKKLAVQKIRQLNNTNEATDGEVIVESLVLKFEALIGTTASAYILKDNTQQLYLIPFNSIPREDLPKLLTESFQLTVDEHGLHPKFVSHTSLTHLQVQAATPNLATFATFKQWESGREYLINQEHIVQNGKPPSYPKLTLRYVTSVGSIDLFELLNFEKDPELKYFSPLKEKDILHSLSLSKFVHPEATVVARSIIKPYTTTDVSLAVYGNLSVDIFKNSENIQNTYPHYTDLAQLKVEPSTATWTDIQNAKRTVARSSCYGFSSDIEGTAYLDGVAIDIKMASDHVWHFELSVEVGLQDVPLENVVAFLQKMQRLLEENNQPANVRLRENAHEKNDVSYLMDSWNEMSHSEQQRLGKYPLSSLTKSYGFARTYRIEATSKNMSSILSYYRPLLDSLEFEVIKVGDFIFI